MTTTITQHNTTQHSWADTRADVEVWVVKVGLCLVVVSNAVLTFGVIRGDGRIHTLILKGAGLHFVMTQMKIQGQNKEMLAAACQMFMGKSEGEIAHIALETLEGHQRAIIAHLTVEVRPERGRCGV